MATPAVYTRLAHLYAGHAPRAGPASACPIREAVGQSTGADSLRVYSGTYVGRDGRSTGVGDHVVGAERDGYAGAGERLIRAHPSWRLRCWNR